MILEMHDTFNGDTVALHQSPPSVLHIYPDFLSESQFDIITTIHIYTYISLYKGPQ